MNIWVMLIFILVVSLILGPIMMLKPNPAQQRKEGLRLRAHELGLRFALRALPKLATDMELPTPMPVYYLPPVDLVKEPHDWMLVRTSYAHDGNFYHDWDWQGSDQPAQTVKDLLLTQLPTLPQGVRAIANGHQGTAVYWDERGNDEVLSLLALFLKSLQSHGVNR